MKKYIFVLSISLLWLSALFYGKGVQAGEPTKIKIPPAFGVTGSVRVVVVTGSNYEMGYQLGLQTAERIVHNIAVFKGSVLPSYGAETIKKDMEVCDYYTKKYVPTMTEWFNGIIDGCKAQGYDIDYLDLVLIQSFDVMAWWHPKTEYPPEAVVHCTASAATGNATRDGKTYVMTSLMTGPTGFDKIILVAFPEQGNSFIANTASGLLVETSGMNSKGFAWIVTAAPQIEPAWGSAAMPIGFNLTQNISSPSEAEKWIASVPRGGATGNFVLADASGYISVLESNSQHWAIRHPNDLGENDWIVNANHFVIPEMKPYNVDTYVPDTKYRYATAWQYFSKAAPNSIDPNFFKTVFSSYDWYDPDKEQWHYNDPGSKNCLGNFRIESTTIYCPNDLAMYCRIGSPGIGYPANSSGEFIKLIIGKSPGEVVGAAIKDSMSYYMIARTAYLKAKNSNASYLSPQISVSLQETLNQAMLEWELGGDRAGFAITSKDPKTALTLSGEALTHFVSSQVFSQRVSTHLSEFAKTN